MLELCRSLKDLSTIPPWSTMFPKTAFQTDQEISRTRHSIDINRMEVFLAKQGVQQNNAILSDLLTEYKDRIAAGEWDLEDLQTLLEIRMGKVGAKTAFYIKRLKAHLKWRIMCLRG